MAQPKKKIREHVHYHRDGSVWAQGQMSADDTMCGYWEWFRKDGTKMRSGYFEDGEQVGEWTTFNRAGKVVKVTKMKPKGAKSAPKKKVKKAAKRKAANKKTSRKSK